MTDEGLPGPDERWHGISFPSQGQLRLTSLTLHVDEDGQPQFDLGPVEVRNDMWPTWLGIARQQRDLARAARDSNPGQAESNEAFNDALNAEYQAALMSLCAAAFAMEAFANSVHHHVPASKVSGGSADARIHQTLCRAFKLSNDQSKQFRSTLQQIFRFRDRGVHPPAGFVQPAGHPHFRVGLDPSYVIYRVENAETSCAFVQHVLRVCFRNPRSGSDEFKAWCAARAQELGDPSQRLSRVP